MAARIHADPLDLAGSPQARLLELGGRARPRSWLTTSISEQRRLLLCDSVPAPFGTAVRADTGGTLMLELLPAATRSYFNSAYARGGNDGVVWQGKGPSAAATAGARLRWGIFSAAVEPIAVYEQNDSFPVYPVAVAGYSRFVNPWHLGGIDLPQRFGTGAIHTLDPGQSYARVDAFGLNAGISNENIRWGPALRYPLMFGYNPPGFPHVFAGTGRPLYVGIGHVEVTALVGWLTGSDFFATDTAKIRREIGALMLGFEPRGLDGLSLGIASVFEQNIPPGGLGLRDYISSITQLNPLGLSGANNTGNEMAALYARWAFPTVGFEVYVDYAHDDFAGGLLALLKEPDYSQVYTVGFGKVITGASRWFHISGELTHLEGSLPLRGGRGVDDIYTHGIVIQGHTQDGQLLGAYIGPGSDAQYLGGDMYAPWGRIGVYGERIRYDDDAYYANFARYYGQHGHDVEITGGVRGAYRFRQLQLEAELNASRRWDRSFLGEQNLDWTSLRSQGNFGFQLGLAWLPPAPIWRARR